MSSASRSQTRNTLEPLTADDLIGESAAMQALREQAQRLAAFDVNVLLHGESGTGKERVARVIHSLSARSAGPFVGVNCAAISETLLESELFGHEAGSFTGAKGATLGFIRAADGGTILLDEIGDMSLRLQSKLLRVLEDRTVIPVGGTEPIPVNVRVIAATHRDLAEMVAAGSFRQDLYYRINVVRMSIPPLRERREDIQPLLEHMLDRMAALLETPRKRFSPEAMQALRAYDWPGNARELGNVAQHCHVLGRGEIIGLSDLPAELRAVRSAGRSADRFPTIQELVREHVRKALAMTNGAKAEAAEVLGIDRKTLWRLMRRHSLK